MACVIAMFDLGVKGKDRTPTYILTLFTLAAVAALQASYASSGQTIYGFGNMIVSDAMGNWLNALPLGCDGDLGLRTSLCGRSRHATRR
jgi:hypothetical protein